MADASSTAKKIKDEEIKFVDLRFTDPRGKMQHVTMDASLMDEEASPKVSCSMGLPLQAGRPSTSRT